AGAALNFAAYLVPLFEERRRAPKTDLISALAAAEEAGDRLGADERLTTAVLLLTAGPETTITRIGHGLLALWRHPDHRSHPHPPAGARAGDRRTGVATTRHLPRPAVAARHVPTSLLTRATSA